MLIDYRRLLLFKNLRLKNLHESGEITSGRVVSLFDAFRASTGFEYFYFYKGKRFEGKDYFDNVPFSIRDSIFQRSVPVLVLPDRPSESMLLFEDLNLGRLKNEVPDSLIWVMKYFRH